MYTRPSSTRWNCVSNPSPRATTWPPGWARSQSLSRTSGPPYTDDRLEVVHLIRHSADQPVPKRTEHEAGRLPTDWHSSLRGSDDVPDAVFVNMLERENGELLILE